MAVILPELTLSRDLALEQTSANSLIYTLTTEGLHIDKKNKRCYNPRCSSKEDLYEHWIQKSRVNPVLVANTVQFRDTA